MNIEHVREFNNRFLDLADQGFSQKIEWFKKAIDEAENEISKRYFTDFLKTLFINLPKMIISGLLNIGHLTDYEIHSTKERYRNSIKSCNESIALIKELSEVFASMRNTLNMNDELSMEFYKNISTQPADRNPVRLVILAYTSVCEKNGMKVPKLSGSYKNARAWGIVRDISIRPEDQFAPMKEYVEKEFPMNVDRNIRRVKCPNCGVINKCTSINCFACNHQLE